MSGGNNNSSSSSGYSSSSSHSPSHSHGSPSPLLSMKNNETAMTTTIMNRQRKGERKALSAKHYVSKNDGNLFGADQGVEDVDPTFHRRRRHDDSDDNNDEDGDAEVDSLDWVEDGDRAKARRRSPQKKVDGRIRSRASRLPADIRSREKQQTLNLKRRQEDRRRKSTSTSSAQVARKVIQGTVRYLASTMIFTLRLFLTCLSPLLPLLPYLLGFGLFLGSIYMTYAYLQGGFNHLLESINPVRLVRFVSTRFSSRPLLEVSYGVHRFAVHSTLSVASLYCSTIGIGCDLGRQERATHIGGVARVAKEQAEQAMDIFQSVLALGETQSGSGGGTSMMNLHHVELWELSSAVRHTSALENREFLGEQLQDLGDLTREVRDEIVRLNSLGINSFTWIVNEFTMLERLVEQAQLQPSVRNSEKLENRLNLLFERLSKDLDTLIVSLDRAIPVADRASGLGHKLIGALDAEQHKLEKEKGELSLWKSIVQRQSWKGKQLRRDLRLAEESVGNVKMIREGLERTRSHFIEYNTNVGLFKAGVVGFHLAGHDLSPEEEVISLGEVMGQFRETLAVAKQRGRRSLKPPSSHAMIGDGKGAM